MANSKTHHGKNIKRLREMLGVKQIVLATELGSDWNQKKISLLEDKPEIDDTLLGRVAEILKVPADLIDNFDEEKAIYNIQNNYEGANTRESHVGPSYQDCTFNPLDKWIEAVAKNEALYERLLQSEKEKVELLTATLQRLEGLMKK
ncbi:helix-turn-helix domain-containing protein [Chitinophagaceae bacterium MMS25-I14]